MLQNVKMCVSQRIRDFTVTLEHEWNKMLERLETLRILFTPLSSMLNQIEFRLHINDVSSLNVAVSYM